jgi:hypothetical protein
MKLTDIKQLSWTPSRVLAFGDSKTGKSTLASWLASQFYLDWFDLENGSSVLYKLPAEQQERINLIKIPDTKDWPIAIETINKVVRGTKGIICHMHGKMGCDVCSKQGLGGDEFDLRTMYGKDRILVLDSGTQIGVSALNRILHGKDDSFKAGWEEYRQQGTKLDGIYSLIQQSWYNVVLICHTTQARMEDDKTKLVPVSGTDNYSRNLARFFDHIVYCDIGLGKHNYGSSTTYRPSILAGSRLDVAVETMKVPSLLPFFDGTIKTTEQVENKAATILTSAIAQVAKLK